MSLVVGTNRMHIGVDMDSQSFLSRSANANHSCRGIPVSLRRSDRVNVVSSSVAAFNRFACVLPDHYGGCGYLTHCLRA